MYKLLTQETKSEVEREYALRRLSVALVLAALLLLCGLCLVLPSLIYARAERDGARVALRAARDSSLESDQEELLSWAASLERKMLALAPYTLRDVPYARIAAVLETVPDGIRLTGFSWQRSASETLDVRGVARDREALLFFQTKLKASEMWKEVQFPVDALASDSDVEFELKLIPN